MAKLLTIGAWIWAIVMAWLAIAAFFDLLLVAGVSFTVSALMALPIKALAEPAGGRFDPTTRAVVAVMMCLAGLAAVA